jgi:tryptophan synthase beta chain
MTETAAENIRLMAEKLSAEPDNQALRLELIRAYTAAGRVDEFLREAEVYKARQQLEPPAAPAGGSAPGFLDPLPMPPTRKRFGTDEAAKAPLQALARGYERLRTDPAFLAGLDAELTRIAYRPTPLALAQRLTDYFGGARIYLKLEHTGRTDPHLSIAVAGQVYLAQALGRRRVYAGVRDLHWGVRAASACARFGLEAEIFVDEQLHEAQNAQVFQMQLMGARVMPVRLSRLPHSDIREAALAAWLRSPDDTFLFMGLDSGPDPYSHIARDLTAVIGREMARQVAADAGRGPDLVVVRGGENADAIGALPAFLDDTRVRLVSVTPASAPELLDRNKLNPFFVAETGLDAARAHAILEGLEYESVARERKLLAASGRVEAVHAGIDAARDVLRNVARLEGVQLGLQTAHALAWACEAARNLPKEGIVAVLLAERPDKDLWDVARLENLGV